MYDYGPSSNFQGFDFLASYVYLLCILFFFKSKQKKKNWQKSATQSLQALYYIFLQEE